MPTIGSPAIILVLALMNAALGVGLAFWVRPRRIAVAAAGAVAALLIVVIGDPPWPGRPAQ